MLLTPSFVRRRIRIRRLLIVILALFLLDAVHTVSRLPNESTGSKAPNLVRKTSGQDVFIASVHRDSAPRLHATWSSAVLDLIKRLGIDNIYFSAVEFGSSDGTRNELLQLKSKLEKQGVSHSIVFGKTAHDLQDDASDQPTKEGQRTGWIWNKRKREYLLRRLPLHAEARNHALAPLHYLADQGRVFQTVLWIDDDIVFGSEDVLDLLDTRDGNYTAVCATDIGAYPRLRSVAALRDDVGQPPASRHWPWFLSHTSRSAAEAQDPIPVSSCWDGLIAFDATPFYANTPLKFRAVDDTLADLNIEASETCLIHADNAPSIKGVWMNPKVRVAHSVKAYNRLQGGPFPDWMSAIVGSWDNRIERWRAPGALAKLESEIRARIRQKASSGDANEQRLETGIHCLVDDMNIIKPKGPDWLFIKQSPGM